MVAQKDNLYSLVPLNKPGMEPIECDIRRLKLVNRNTTTPLPESSARTEPNSHDEHITQQTNITDPTNKLYFNLRNRRIAKKL